ncbi:hypothetical protein MTO96_009331 [Rhipicephalus appendiculatus]
MTNFLSHSNVAQAGDTCVVYCTFAHIYSIKLAHGEVFQTKYGALKHDEVIGRTYGSKVQCSCGYVYVLRATPELWTLTLPHRTQILYTRDISLVTLQLDLKTRVGRMRSRHWQWVNDPCPCPDCSAEWARVHDGFGIEGLADAVFLDLPHPWKAVDAAASALKPGYGGPPLLFLAVRGTSAAHVRRLCVPVASWTWSR